MSKDWSDRILISDLADEPALSDELSAICETVCGERADPAKDVVLNFAAVTYLNSSNIAQLLKLRAGLHNKHCNLRFCSVADPVWSIMLLTGLDKIFQFAPDPATAIASLQLDGDPA